MSRKKQTSTTRASAPGNLTYVPWTGSFPSQAPTVQIVFHGLLCFFFDGSNLCEVGVHNTTQGLGHTHPQEHDYVVSVWTKFDGQCSTVPERYPVNNPKSVSGLEINVFNPAPLVNGVYVFEKSPFDTFDRLDSDPQNPNDPRDWRWLIDFERDVYPGGIPTKKPTTFRPSVRIRNGLFYTLHKTFSKFRLHPSGDADPSHDKPIGNVAEVLAANIYLEPGGSVLLSGGPFPRIFPRPLVALPGVTYQVDITNNCNSSLAGCHFDPDPSKPKDKRNDFFLYYDTFVIPQGQPEFELIRIPPVHALTRTEKERQQALDICVEDCPNRVLAMTDDAPCGATGFGQSSTP